MFGYAYDRESSEFTVFHLKQLLRWVAEQPEVERIQLIAHSRGTDVASSALRELIIWASGAGVDPREKFKIANFVMAAPDLDMSVVSQRLAAERIGLAIDEVTLYTSPEDRAISIAEWLFSSQRGRLGTLGIEDISAEERLVMKANVEHLTVVIFGGDKTGYGHSYFRTNPEVSSDLMLLLRFGYQPGSPGRPLEHVGLGFWRIPSGYPVQNARQSTADQR